MSRFWTKTDVRAFAARDIQRVRKDIRAGKCSLADYGLYMIGNYRLKGPGRINRSTYDALKAQVERCFVKKRGAH